MSIQRWHDLQNILKNWHTYSKLCGAELLEISKAGSTVSARLLESQTWQPPAGSVGEEFSKGTMAPAYLEARHFSSSLNVAVAFQAAALVLELRGSESE